ncbi:MAG TPA: mannose-6-phosphate isomerase, class I [Jatrophihabitans sp.]|jgi:mannose-6-phosphate isomerase|uniref:mannose-6-phosphate isomerase, class I n=1 Tax=Jatrophihabitans sp. TaxID=1932789 RepID=UPI002EFB3CAE
MSPAAGQPRLITLDNAIREYAWGSVEAIPALLGVPPTGRPAAELWMGAHPDEPSRCAEHPDRPALDELIAQAPRQWLGEASLAAFGPRLPFLMKLLAADRALSMQVHPSQAQAEAGFAAEEAAGVPRRSAERTYSDPHHKPELAYALTEFDAFCGFRPVPATLELLEALQVPELAGYLPLLAGRDGLRATFTTLLSLSGQARERLVEATVAGCRRLAEQDSPWAAAARASALAAQDFPGDIGAVLALLLNYVRLAPGEAIYLGAGNVHAYLRGVCIEILANSDNVLRCGLTPKHVDIPELLRVADFSSLAEPRWQPSRLAEGQLVFEVPVPDFRLSVLDLVASTHEASAAVRLLPADGPHLVLSGAGEVTVDCGAECRTIRRWESLYVAPGAPACTVSGNGQAFVASVNL